MAIDPLTSVISSATSTVSAAASAGASSSSDAGFGGALNSILGAVDQSNTDANGAVAKMLDGSGDVHDAMIALQKADMMLQFTVQVRNKIVQAYQDVMRMPA